jgi:hypothetical protein
LQLTDVIKNSLLILFLCLAISKSSASINDCILIQKISGISGDEKKYFQDSLQVGSFNLNSRIVSNADFNQCDSQIEVDIVINTAAKMIFFSLVDISAKVKIFSQNKKIRFFEEKVSHSDGGIPTGVVELIINTFKVQNIELKEIIEMNLFNLSRKIIQRITNIDQSEDKNQLPLVYDWEKLQRNNGDSTQLLIQNLIMQKDYEKALLIIQNKISEGNNKDNFDIYGIIIAKELNQPLLALKLYQSILKNNYSSKLMHDYLYHSIKYGLSKQAFEFIQNANISLDQIDDEDKPLLLEVVAFNNKNKAIDLFKELHKTEREATITKRLIEVLEKFGVWQQLELKNYYETIIIEEW